MNLQFDSQGEFEEFRALKVTAFFTNAAFASIDKQNPVC
jgi:hypothetical protein